ncbi:MAG: hypothetical protein K6G07_06505 [Lachnospiraceae bacterium]|nr:hypothetical protein [Lachnospiraceae bacterium]
MEYLIVAGVFVGCYLLFIAIGIRDRKREDARFIKKLKEGYGIPSTKQYKTDRLKYLASLAAREKRDEELFVDDVTWNDLDMDRVMGRMDYTNSSVGEDALYRMLRFPVRDENVIAKRCERLRFLSEHEADRNAIFLSLRHIGYAGKYGIRWYLDSMDEVPKVSQIPTILIDILLVVTLILGLSVHVGFFLAFIVLLVINVITYMMQKSSLAPYLAIFFYLLNILDECRTGLPLSKECKELFKDCMDAIEAGGKSFRKVMVNAFFFGGEQNGGNEILSIVIMYVNICFHFDMLAFYRSVHYITEHKDDFQGMLTALGELECAASLCCYKKSLPMSCEPEFVGDCSIDAKQTYHPLLKDPVCNDVRMKKSVLLTGSNASGKSTYLKSVILNAIAAQTIGVVCAASYKATFFAPYSSMALRDDIFGGESYFIVEINSLKRIFDAAETEEIPVLCAVDEVLRGTNTAERIGAGCALLEKLAEGNCLCIAATHDLELTDLLKERYENMHFEETVEDGTVSFAYKLKEGPAKTRNAIRLLKARGFGADLTDKAERLALSYMDR